MCKKGGELNMINEIEKALSNHSICNRCKQTIEVGTLRGVANGVAFGHKTSSYYCKKCTKDLLESQIKYSQGLLEKLA